MWHTLKKENPKLQTKHVDFPNEFTIMSHVSWPQVEDSKLAFCNLLVRLVGGVLVVRCDKAASPPHQVLFLDPPFPGGKFHLRICWDIKSWLARPRGRPPIGWLSQLCRKIISRLNSPSLPASQGKAQLRYLSWKLYLKLYLSWKLLNIGFPQQTREHTQLEACSPTNPGRLKHQIHVLHFEEIFPLLFALFSVRFIRRAIEDWTRALADKWKIQGARFFRNKFSICREQLFKFDANVGEMCKANSWNPAPEWTGFICWVICWEEQK